MSASRSEEWWDAASDHIVTGPRRVRGRAGDDRRTPAGRGLRPDSAPFGAQAELEELSTGRLDSSRGTRLGAGPILAAGILVVFLAAGLGVFGGRASEATTPGVAVASSAGATGGPIDTAFEVAPTPQVTPWAACGSTPTQIPEVVLVVDGWVRPAAVVAQRWTGASPPPAARPPLEQPPFEIRPEVVSEIWLTGGACANAWDIGFGDEGRLEAVDNPALDPRVAAQNRFRLNVAPYGGRDLELRADLTFPTLVARATWNVRIHPLARPQGWISDGDSWVEASAGCDVTVTLAVGWTDSVDCTGSVRDQPSQVIATAPGRSLKFVLQDEGPERASIGGGWIRWRIDEASITCGRFEGSTFTASSEAACDTSTVLRDDWSATFTAPATPGRWTVAIAACGVVVPQGHVACGTWYADVDVRA